MSAFDAIDLSRLPVPDAVTRIDAEAELARLKAALLARVPDLADTIDLESEPVVGLLQVAAYQRSLLAAEMNDRTRAVMLAFATGADLDNLAALFGVARLVLVPGDAAARPVVPPVMEADDALRSRTQLALEGYTTAGSRGAYVFHAKSADARVADVQVTSPTPGTVRIVVLDAMGDGTPDAGLLTAVAAAVNADHVRDLCAQVSVVPPTIQTYQITATLEMAGGPDPAVVLDQARASVAAYAAESRRLGRDISISGIHAALHKPGVDRVRLSSPAADIEIADEAAANCTAIAVTQWAGN